MCSSTRTGTNQSPPPPASTTVTGEAVRVGTVAAVGRLAATVAERGSRRQFYAPLEQWEGHTFMVGDTVTFRADATRTAGSHRVGADTYDRFYCAPA